jgi:UDPglucose 6-dehydrogenase
MIRGVAVRENPLELAILGAGYVGLVTAACLARLGHRVVCIDHDEERVERLRQAIMPFQEPGLDTAVADGVAAGRLIFATRLEASRGADAILVAVGTLDAEGEWSSDQVETAVAEVAAESDAPRAVIIRSTLLPGTTNRLADAARQRDARVDICFNPEFTRQGSAVADYFTPDRIIFGTTQPEESSIALPILRAMYAGIDAPTLVTDALSAELIKIGANAFLALKVGFANELARLAAATGADISQVVDGIGMDRRIGRGFMTPGPGFGGSCLPSQARALPRFAHAADVDAPILDAVDSSNISQARWVVDTAERAAGGLAGQRVALLGLTFKQGTDDVRDSPALAIALELINRGAFVVAHDPVAPTTSQPTTSDGGKAIERADSAVEAACAAVAVIVATDWPEYRTLDWNRIAADMSGTTVVDTRAAVDSVTASAAGLTVLVHGRRV